VRPAFRGRKCAGPGAYHARAGESSLTTSDSNGALSVEFSLKHLRAAYGTYALLVRTRVAIDSGFLMNGAFANLAFLGDGGAGFLDQY